MILPQQGGGAAGTLVEVVTVDGLALEVRFAGASNLAKQIALDAAFPSGIGAPFTGIVHLCAYAAKSSCPFNGGGRTYCRRPPTLATTHFYVFVQRFWLVSLP